MRSRCRMSPIFGRPIGVLDSNWTQTHEEEVSL
jgi:hypothetical protein